MRYAPVEERTRSAKETSHEKEYHRNAEEKSTEPQSAQRNLTVGIDLGDRSSRYCILNQEGEVVAASAVATTKKDLSRVFGTLRPSRLALEVGTHSPWVSRHLKAMGHE